MTKAKSLLIAGGIAGLAMAAAALTAGPALANGGDFFNELSQSWGANIDTGTPFFGWVRDANGKAIPRAIVTATVQGGVDGEAVTIISDNLGHYRIPGLGKDVNPKNVVIECAKVGYREALKDRRVMRTMPKAPIEVDCKLTPLTAQS
jgi:hypothetical protein